MIGLSHKDDHDLLVNLMYNHIFSRHTVCESGTGIAFKAQPVCEHCREP